MLLGETEKKGPATRERANGIVFVTLCGIWERLGFWLWPLYIEKMVLSSITPRVIERSAADGLQAR